MSTMTGSNNNQALTTVVREYSGRDAERWDRFVENHPAGTFFHLSGWQRIIGDILGHDTYFLLCERDDEIVGVLPLARVKSLLFGSALTSLPFLVYGGPLAIDADIEEILVESACQRCNDIGADHLELRNKRPSGRDWPTKDIYATFSKSLDPDPEANLLAIPRKQRAMIRKGIKAGLAADPDLDVAQLHAALLECKRNLGTPFFDSHYLRALCDEFGDKVEILTVRKGAQLVCSVMSFRFRNEILPYYGGGGDLARQFKGNDFMYWSVMEKACADGVEVFDFGRSMVGGGAYRFKKHWGFEPQPLAYEFYLGRASSMPNLNPSNPKYELAINIWKRLPVRVAGILGPPLARRLG